MRMRVISNSMDSKASDGVLRLLGNMECIFSGETSSFRHKDTWLGKAEAKVKPLTLSPRPLTLNPKP